MKCSNTGIVLLSQVIQFMHNTAKTVVDTLMIHLECTSKLYKNSEYLTHYCSVKHHPHCGAGDCVLAMGITKLKSFV